MPALKSRFHATTSAFCSVTVEEIVRGETREEKMFVVERLWIRRVEERKERKGREERKQRQQAIVLSLLVVRLPAVTSPLFTPTPEQLSRAFLFRHRFDIHCATDSLFLRRSDPVKQRYRSIIFFSSFQVNGVIPFIPVFRIFNFCLKYNLPNYSLHERVE